MLFNSYIFIFIFLPIVLIGWYGLNHFKKYQLAMLFLSGMSLWFYAYFNVKYLAIIVVSILVNYTISAFIEKVNMESKLVSRLFLLAGILFNIGVFFYFKYFDFFIENVNAVFKTDFALRNIILPLGISFFTFQQLSFVIDRSLGRAEHYSFVNYLTFVTFFPQLIAGPIVLYKEMIPQFERPENRVIQSENITQGIVMFCIGMGKKVLLADVLALPVNYGFAQTFSLDSISTFFVILCYTFEIYFDFSGYCDMAMGLAKMFNITLPVNFNSPYKSCTVKELWNRWHMTLSRFFITYVYIPLGGNRKGKARTAVNTLLVFTLSGLWHGANWTYVMWGLIHGILVAFENLHLIGVRGQKEKVPSKVYVPKWVGWFFTFSMFVISLFFFRSESMIGAIQMFKNLFSFSNNGTIYAIASQMKIPEFYIIEQAVKMLLPSLSTKLYLILMVLYLIFCFFLVSRKNSMEIAERGYFSKKMAVALAILLLWCVISLSQVSTFLYFNF